LTRTFTLFLVRDMLTRIFVIILRQQNQPPKVRPPAIAGDTECYNMRYNVCRDAKCVLLNTTYKSFAGPKGLLWKKKCVECDIKITTKTFDLLPVYYCENVRNWEAGEFDDDVATLPQCQNVICGNCARPPEKQRERTKILFKGMNGDQNF
jgi:hypothetical protein